MNICLLNDSFPPSIDGVANAVYNYAEILTNAGDDVTVATPKYPGVIDNYPFDVVRYTSANTVKLAGYRAGLPIVRETIRTLSGKEPQVLHSHCPVASTILARALRETADAPIILTYHTKFDIDIANLIRSHLLQEAAIKLLCNNITACDEVWVVSRIAGENLRSLGYQGDYVIMENGVDLPKGRVDDNKVQALRTQHGIAESDLVFLFVGRLMWYKGIKIILDSLAALKAQGLKFSMVFVGDGRDRADIEKYAQSLALDVIFTGAVNDRELLRQYYCLGDIFLFPSTFDTNGLVVREAAACSLPSILIKDSAAAEGVEDGFSGFLSEENAESFAAVLKNAVSNRDHLKKTGENARDFIYTSWEDSVKRARARYEIVAENYKSRGSHHQKLHSDEIFELIGSVNAGLDRLSSAYSRLGQTTQKMGDNITHFLDKHL